MKRSIGIIRTQRIGDVVLASSALEVFQDLKEDFHVVWIGRWPAGELIKGAWPSVEFILWDKKESPKILAQKLGNLDILVDLQSNSSSWLLGLWYRWLWGKKVWVVPRNRLRRALMILKARFSSYKTKRFLGAGEFQFQSMARVCVQAAGLALDTPLHPPRWNLNETKAFMLSVGLGASYPTKRAPEKLFLDILLELRSLLGEKNLPTLCFLGDQADEALATHLQNLLKWPTVLHQCGKLSLWESSKYLAKSLVFLGNDSGLAHIAEAVQTPVGVLMGPTHEAFGFAPHLSLSQAFSLPMACRPCSRHGSNLCKYGEDHRYCFQLNPKNIANFLAKRLLNRVSS